MPNGSARWATARPTPAHREDAQAAPVERQHAVVVFHRVPDTLPLVVQRLHQMVRQGQDEHERVIGHGVGVRTRRVGDLDVGGDDLGHLHQPVDAHAGIVDPAEAGGRAHFLARRRAVEGVRVDDLAEPCLGSLRLDEGHVGKLRAKLIRRQDVVVGVRDYQNLHGSVSRPPGLGGGCQNGSGATRARLFGGSRQPRHLGTAWSGPIPIGALDSPVELRGGFPPSRE